MGTCPIYGVDEHQFYGLHPLRGNTRAFLHDECGLRFVETRGIEPLTPALQKRCSAD